MANIYENRIRELRQEKGITQIRLSIELEVTQETISAYENGKHLPSLPALIKLSDLFGTSMDYIMKRTNHRIHLENSNLRPDEDRLLSYYKLLGTIQKEKAISYIQGLSDSGNIR
ncbi:MAG: helix-turn-helix transcriptional regulator [Lachnospira sp.]|nr:helix-turn-helix transcriptional regulator [Lachnospira sp.]